MKGVIIKNYSNIKSMDGTANPTDGAGKPYTMQIGDYAFGDLSATQSDLINFDHFYLANGQRVELKKMCKATATNMKITNETEPTTPPNPDPQPPTDPESVKTILYSDITYETNSGEIKTVRMIPE